MVTAFRLVGGETIAADLVVAGLGVQPETGFLSGVRRDGQGGLIADASLKIAEDLYAAGDAAAFPRPGHQERICEEHWRVAEQQGRVAARATLGKNAIYDPVPVFWTIQYMKRLDYVGHASGEQDLALRGEPGEQNFIAYFLKDGLVKAAAGMNRDADMAALIALMTSQRDWRLDDIHPPNGTPQDMLNRREGRPCGLRGSSGRLRCAAHTSGSSVPTGLPPSRHARRLGLGIRHDLIVAGPRFQFAGQQQGIRQQRRGVS